MFKNKFFLSVCIVLLSISSVLMLTGCPSPEDPVNSVPQAEPEQKSLFETSSFSMTDGHIGTKAPDAAKALGDVVFSDGSATPFADIQKRTGTHPVTKTKLWPEEKEAVMAYIFYSGTGMNNGGDTTTTRTLGVGVEVDTTNNKWRPAFIKDCAVPALNCIATKTPDGYSFSGTKNGTGLIADAFTAYKESIIEEITETKEEIETALNKIDASIKASLDIVNKADNSHFAQGYNSNTAKSRLSVAESKMESIRGEMGAFNAAFEEYQTHDVGQFPDPLDLIRNSINPILNAISGAKVCFPDGSEEYNSLNGNYETILPYKTGEFFEYIELPYPIHQNGFNAFVNAEQYGASFASYSDGWYLPTIAELYEVWKKKDDLSAIMGKDYKYTEAVSATPDNRIASYCCLLDFSSDAGEISYKGKGNVDNSFAVFAIREF